ncbi:hypothetical protein GCM10027056_28550 [Glaciibacter psychrotolerans]
MQHPPLAASHAQVIDDDCRILGVHHGMNYSLQTAPLSSMERLRDVGEVGGSLDLALSVVGSGWEPEGHR